FAALVIVPAIHSVAAAAESTSVEPGTTTSIPEPEADGSAISADEAGPEAGSPPSATDVDAGSGPDPEAAAPPPVEVQRPTTAGPGSTTDASALPATPAETGSEPGADLDPTLLDAAEPEATTPVATQPREASASAQPSPEEQAAALDAAYAARYRPADNPVRLNIAARLLFANVSGREHVNGRIGGAAIDVGPAWNYIAPAATVSAWGGRIQLPEDVGAELNAMIGGGLSLGLGRLALMTHGYLDLRVGYDVYYGVVNRRSDAPSIVAAQDEDPRVSATLTENLLPHGPRLRLDMGLVGATNRRFFHGLGLSMGYQALVGSFRGDLPPTSMLTLGFSYWMG
ncbi:MAG: hypothetical protein KDK70_37750, partial [Myxococcales bacterium]|nr:hypothetical protein [Myxococcales bacterium]